VGLVADKLNRRGIVIELNPTYAEISGRWYVNEKNQRKRKDMQQQGL
jgi:hypothetical protein